MSETLLGVFIGAIFGLFGSLVGATVSALLERDRASRERLREVRLRLVGESIQTSEVMNFIKSQRRRKWPMFWKREEPDLSRADLHEVDLRSRDLRRIILYRANLSKADLQGANLEWADLSKANLTEADLSGANLCTVNLFGTNLSKSDLSHAKLARANLSGAVLRDANLAKADLSGAYMYGADLSNANLSGAKLDGAFLLETIMPNSNAASDQPEWEACEIEWVNITNIGDHLLARSRGYFKASAIGPSGSYLAGATLDGLIIDGRARKALKSNDNVRQAFEELISELIKDGWEPVEGRGNDWFSQRFRRRIK